MDPRVQELHAELERIKKICGLLAHEMIQPEVILTPGGIAIGPMLAAALKEIAGEFYPPKN